MRGQVEGQGGGPGQGLVGAPPSAHNEGHEETQHEGDGNQTAELAAVDDEVLKGSGNSNNAISECTT